MCKTGCVPHFCQYKEVAFLFLFPKKYQCQILKYLILVTSVAYCIEIRQKQQLNTWVGLHSLAALASGYYTAGGAVSILLIDCIRKLGSNEDSNAEPSENEESNAEPSQTPPQLAGGGASARKYLVVYIRVST